MTGLVQSSRASYVKGASDPNDYYMNILNNPTAYADGADYLFGRHYLIPGVTWQITPLTSLACQVLANLNDGSFLLAPNLEYNATANMYLSVGGYLAIGEHPTADQVLTFADQVVVIPSFNSEFGAYPTEYYGFLRYYF